MSAVRRGSRNALRNPLRAIAVTIILGISFGLTVVMLAARSAVDNRIAEVKKSIGNTVAVSPAGARGFLGGGEPLKNSQVDGLRALAHVSSVDATIDAQLTTDDTSLQSAIELGTLGGRGFHVFGQVGHNGSTTQPPSDFKPPIMAVGTTNSNYGGGLVGSNLSITSGSVPDMTGEDHIAVIGKNLAEKNSLQVGSTFTAFGTKITVAATYDAGNQFANNAVVFPLKTLQQLSGQSDAVTEAVAHVDSVDNLASVVTAIKEKLGDAADVTSSEETVTQAVQPLANIRRIATISLIGALIAAGIITLLTMVMIVRERRKEIAVLKALGAGDSTIITQFTTEALALSLLGGVIGSVLGFVFSNPILNALVSGTRGDGPGRSMTAGGGMRMMVNSFAGVKTALQNLSAGINLEVVLYGLLAAVLVAVIGSAFPAWLIAKIRPAEVLRND